LDGDTHDLLEDTIQYVPDETKGNYKKLCQSSQLPGLCLK